MAIASGFLAYGCLAWVPALGTEETEVELLSRLPRETHPGKRMKLELKVARLSLKRAETAYTQSNPVLAQESLEAYSERIQQAWTALERAGWQADRHVSDFKHLDFRLYEDGRRLEDLKQKVAYTDRAAVQEAQAIVRKVREEVLAAIFPPESR